VGFARGTLRPLATGPVPGSTLGPMEQDTSIATVVPTDDADEALVEEELLVEEISIDGMCGVY
jgi:mycofactocin precursor